MPINVIPPGAVSPPTDKTEIAPNSPTLPGDKAELTPGSPAIPADKTELTPGDTAAPVDKTEVAPGSVDIPGDLLEIPAGSVALPVDKTELAPVSPAIPVDKTELAPGSAALPNDKTEIAPGAVAPPNDLEEIENVPQIIQNGNMFANSRFDGVSHRGWVNTDGDLDNTLFSGRPTGIPNDATVVRMTEGESPAVSEHGCEQWIMSGFYIDSNKITVSIYMLPLDSNTGGFRITYQDGSEAVLIADASDGSILVSTGSAVFSVVDAGNGWYRLIVVKENIGPAQNEIRMKLLVTDGATLAYAPIGNSVYFCAPSLNPFAEVTDYILTNDRGGSFTDNTSRAFIGYENYIPYSIDAFGGDWVSSGMTLTSPSSSIAPDSMDGGILFLRPASGLGEHNVRYETISGIGNNESVTFSVFASEETNGLWLILAIVDKAGGIHRAWFDLSDGSVGTIDPGIIATHSEPGAFNPIQQDQWNRIGITADSGIGSVLGVHIGFSDTDGVLEYNPNQIDGVLMFIAQLNLGNTMKAGALTAGTAPASEAAAEETNPFPGPNDKIEISPGVVLIPGDKAEIPPGIVSPPNDLTEIDFKPEIVTPGNFITGSAPLPGTISAWTASWEGAVYATSSEVTRPTGVGQAGDSIWRSRELTNAEAGRVEDGEHEVRQVINPGYYVNSSSMTFSVYLQAGTVTTAGVRLKKRDGSTSTVIVDLTNGNVLSNVGGDAAVVEDNGDSWYRVSIVATNIPPGNGPIEASTLLTQGTTLVYPGVDTNVIYATYQQLTPFGSVTPYERTDDSRATTGAANTRANSGGTNYLAFSVLMTNNWFSSPSALLQNKPLVRAPDSWLVQQAFEGSNASASEHIVWRDVPNADTADNESLTFSAYVRAEELNWIVLRVTDRAGVARQAWFDSLNGVAGVTDAGVTTHIEACANPPQQTGNIFYRLGITVNSGAGANDVRCTLALAPSDGALNFFATGGEGYYVFGAQLSRANGFTGSALTAGATPVSLLEAEETTFLDGPNDKAELLPGAVQIPVDKTELAAGAVAVPVDKTELAASSPAIPVDKTELAAGAVAIPGDKTEIAVGAVAIPTDKAELAAGAVAVPVDKTELAASSPAIPVDKTELAAGAVTIPGSKTTIPSGDLSGSGLYASFQFKDEVYQASNGESGFSKIFRYERAGSATFVNRMTDYNGDAKYFLDEDFAGTVTNVASSPDDFSANRFQVDQVVTYDQIPGLGRAGILLVPTAGTTIRDAYQQQSFSKTAAVQTRVNMSMYAKQGGYNQVRMLAYSDTTANSYEVEFDLISGGEVSDTINGAFPSGGNYSRNEYIGNGWHRLSASFTTDADPLLRFRIQLGDILETVADGESGVFVYGVQATESEKIQPFTVFEKTFLASPRIQYSAETGSRRGIIIEQPVTNEFLYSEDLTDAAWSQSVGASIQANETRAPDLARSADRLALPATNINHFLQQTVNVSAASRMVWSIYCRTGGQMFVQLSPDATRFNDAVSYQNFDVRDCSMGSGSLGSGVYAGIDDIGEGWCRIWMTATADSTGDAAFKFSVVGSAAAARDEAFTPNTDEKMYFWGAQLTDRGRVSSYIYTEGSTVSANPDLLTTRVGLLFPRTGPITVVFDWDLDSLHNFLSFMKMLDTGNSDNDGFRMRLDASGLRVANGDAADTTFGDLNDLGPKGKVVYVFDPEVSYEAAYFNGVLLGENSTENFNEFRPTQNTLGIGSAIGPPTQNLIGCISGITMFTRAMTAEEVAQL